jgi:hypothetical protein
MVICGDHTEEDSTAANAVVSKFSRMTDYQKNELKIKEQMRKRLKPCLHTYVVPSLAVVLSSQMM